MKTSVKTRKKSKIVLEISKELERDENLVLFPEKLREANEILSRGGLQKTTNKI